MFSDEFVNEYGDWTIGESTLELNEQGEPEAYYYATEEQTYHSPNVEIIQDDKDNPKPQY